MKHSFASQRPPLFHGVDFNKEHLDFAAGLPATFLPRRSLFVILLDHESGRNNLKHVGQIISAEVSFPSNATADAFFCNPNLDAGLKDC
ncbi:hypothetical protein T4C_380 [Trichinella pseudospiralis]|uniref:Uncharacterized protein n=1 Tax=Trichinella pseudospiralis TaxID=6337 RepID=A0A0V1JZS3_TRIPS|nr:hypothetical protein T4C_380 [Trichinella pseudospiralis]